MVFGHLVVILFLGSPVVTSSAASQASHDASCNATCVYTQEILEAYCVNQALTRVPLGCSPFMTQMDLRQNALTDLQPSSLVSYSHLATLDLALNKICNLSVGAFSGCVSLENVYLQDNLLREIGGDTFEGAPTLNRLYLNKNSILKLHTAAFHSLVNLQYLDLSDNDLQSLPLGIFRDLGGLKFVTIKNNNLQSFRGSLFDGLVNLTKLVLSGNGIVSINGYPTLPALKTLDLFDNDLRNISALAGKISGLKHLYLGDNHNIICTCSINPVRVWLLHHRSDEDANRVDVTCRAPQLLQGLQLHNISNSSLCSKSDLAPSLPPSESSKTPSPMAHLVNTETMAPVPTTTKFTNLKNEWKVGEQKATNNLSKPHSIITYVIAGTGTLLIIILSLIVLNKCLGLQTRRSQQLNRQTKPEEQKPPQRREQSVPMMQMTVNRLSQDDGAYEIVTVQPSSPANDSAFGSQTDLDADTETGGQLRHDTAASNKSDDPYYMSLQDLSVPVAHPLPPPDLSRENDLLPLEQEWPTTNPFLRDLSRDNCFPSSEPYVPHTVFYPVCSNASGNTTHPG